MFPVKCSVNYNIQNLAVRAVMNTKEYQTFVISYMYPVIETFLGAR